MQRNKNSTALHVVEFKSCLLPGAHAHSYHTLTDKQGRGGGGGSCGRQLCVETLQTDNVLIICKTPTLDTHFYHHLSSRPSVRPSIRELLPARWPLSQLFIHPPFSPSGPGNILRFLVLATPPPNTTTIVAINTVMRSTEMFCSFSLQTKQPFIGATHQL